MRALLVLMLSILCLAQAVPVWAQPCALVAPPVRPSDLLAQNQPGPFQPGPNQNGPDQSGDASFMEVIRDPVTGQVQIQGKMGGSSSDAPEQAQQAQPFPGAGQGPGENGRDSAP